MSLNWNYFIAASSPCSYFLTRNSGTFTSPKYPEKPETKLNFLYCQWEIKVETGKEILMRIGDLDIEGPNDDCQQGNVVFYEGIGKSREKMGLLDFSLFFCKF